MMPAEPTQAPQGLAGLSPASFAMVMATGIVSLGALLPFLKRFPLRYDPLYWGAVFPLGMYSAATHEMARALQLEFLGFVAPIFLAVAFAAWTAAFVGSLRMLARWRRG